MYHPSRDIDDVSLPVRTHDVNPNIGRAGSVTGLGGGEYQDLRARRSSLRFSASKVMRISTTYLVEKTRFGVSVGETGEFDRVQGLQVV